MQLPLGAAFSQARGQDQEFLAVELARRTSSPVEPCVAFKKVEFNAFSAGDFKRKRDVLLFAAFEDHLTGVLSQGEVVPLHLQFAHATVDIRIHPTGVILWRLGQQDGQSGAGMQVEVAILVFRRQHRTVRPRHVARRAVVQGTFPGQVEGFYAHVGIVQNGEADRRQEISARTHHKVSSIIARRPVGVVHVELVATTVEVDVVELDVASIWNT